MLRGLAAVLSHSAHASRLTPLPQIALPCSVDVARAGAAHPGSQVYAQIDIAPVMYAEPWIRFSSRIGSDIKVPMKFYALVVLPMGTDVSDGHAIEAAVARQMKPFQMWQDDLSPGAWDYYWCCTREWLEENAVDLRDWPGALRDSEYLVFPADTLTESGVTPAIVTPAPGWFENRDHHEPAAGAWNDRAIAICRQFRGHHIVVVYCHG